MCGREVALGALVAVLLLLLCRPVTSSDGSMGISGVPPYDLTDGASLQSLGEISPHGTETGPCSAPYPRGRAGNLSLPAVQTKPLISSRIAGTYDSFLSDFVEADEWVVMEFWAHW